MNSQRNHNIRVLHCPTYGAGNPGSLSLAERGLGLVSRSVSIEPPVYRFSIDNALNPVGNRKIGYILRELLRWPLLLYAALKADVIHYNFGQTIMPQWYGNRGNSRLLRFYIRLLEHADLKLLKALGKKLVVTYQGDDARQGDYCLEHYRLSAAQFVDDSYYPEDSDDNKRRLIKQVSQYFDRIYALNPDLINVLPSTARFIPYASVNPDKVNPYFETANEVPLVIHAPTHRGVKGSEFIIRAVERLQNEGVRFNFRLIENYSHEEAMRLYEKADLLIDQLLVGWYGGLAVELMALGKPVICYIRDEDLVHIPEEMKNDLPVISAEPQNIYETLKSMLAKSPNELQSLGRQSRSYVERWHHPGRIATILRKDYMSILSIE